MQVLMTLHCGRRQRFEAQSQVPLMSHVKVEMVLSAKQRD